MVELDRKRRVKEPHPWPRRLRRARGKLSLRQLAARAGVSATTVWKLERGFGSVEVFLKVVDALGLRPFEVSGRAA